MPQEILVLALSAGMASADLAAAIDKLKESSKSIGSHKRRQLFWDAYVKMATKANTLDDGAYAFLKYSAGHLRTIQRVRSRWWSSPSASAVS